MFSRVPFQKSIRITGKLPPTSNRSKNDLDNCTWNRKFTNNIFKVFNFHPTARLTLHKIENQTL